MSNELHGGFVNYAAEQKVRDSRDASNATQSRGSTNAEPDNATTTMPSSDIPKGGANPPATPAAK